MPEPAPHRARSHTRSRTSPGAGSRWRIRRRKAWEQRTRCLALLLHFGVRWRVVETATVTLTMTEAAVLALLAIEGEQSPYKLTNAVERAIGHIWSPAKSGLYATLPRLAKDGLAERTGRCYRISPAGSAALEAWLEAV